MRRRIGAELVLPVRLDLPGKLLPVERELLGELRAALGSARQLRAGVRLLVLRLRRLPGGVLLRVALVQRKLRRLRHRERRSLQLRQDRRSELLCVRLVPVGLLLRVALVQRELRFLRDRQWRSQ
jgi:hypothetical protein